MFGTSGRGWMSLLASHLVDWSFFRSWCRCPKTVGDVGYRYLLVASYVKPGQLMKLPFFIACRSVHFGGEKQAPCKKFMRSLFAVFFGIMTLSLFVGELLYIGNFISHRPSV